MIQREKKGRGGLPFRRGLFVLLILLGAWVSFSRSKTSAPTLPSAVSMTQPCPSLTEEERIARADLIVTGEVFAVVPESPFATVLITPSHRYRGEIPESGIAIAAQDSAALGRSISANAMSVDLHFASGQPRYLLYLRLRADGRYNTSACDGSRFLGKGPGDLEAQLLGPGTLVSQK